jgi:branched-chain amino acid transport system permease protein
MLSIGWNIVGGYTYLPSFAQAAFASLAAYISGGFVAYFKTFVPAGMVVAILAITAISFGLGYITLKMSGAYLCLATIAFSEGVRVALFVNPDITGGGAGFFPAPLIPGGSIGEYYYLFMGVTVACFYVTYRLTRSRLGTIMKAVGDDEETAMAVGVDVRHVRLVAFALSGIFAAIGGTLYGHYFLVIVPDNGSLLQMAIIMVGPLVGGVGTLIGPVIGTFIMISVREYIRTYVGQYDVLIYGAMMILLMRFARNGILGIVTSKRALVLRRIMMKAHVNV